MIQRQLARALALAPLLRIQRCNTTAGSLSTCDACLASPSPHWPGVATCVAADQKTLTADRFSDKFPMAASNIGIHVDGLIGFRAPSPIPQTACRTRGLQQSSSVLGPLKDSTIRTTALCACLSQLDSEPLWPPLPPAPCSLASFSNRQPGQPPVPDEEAARTEGLTAARRTLTA
ncbi:hypothetical protein CKAH01_11113 [Colletotrichum kahawae]|uniref:Uncharacterized protein n=1 Tax=Colletotrichum kahawae TaxID=34407 RepID=A0AAD9XUV5_COLKA|nr:hypothetical protein CKAH01_11113 [Colletotrichum kahawae]